ncbi:MAG: AI-2E family transporter, partial [Candidatus Dadabacteria bacterium]
MKLSPTTRLWIVVLGLLSGGLAAVYLLLQVPVLFVPALLSIALFYVVEPVLVWWESFGYTRKSGLLALAGVVLASAALLAVLLPPAVHDQWVMVQRRAPMAVDELNGMVEGIQQRLAEVVPAAAEGVSEVRAKIGEIVGSQILPALPGLIAQMVMGGLLVPIILFFLLTDGRKARKRLLEMVPNRNFEMALNISHRIDQQIGAYLRGVIIEAAGVAGVAWLLL